MTPSDLDVVDIEADPAAGAAAGSPAPAATAHAPQRRPDPAAWSSGRWAAVLAGCVALAVLAFAVPVALAYDPAAWLVWGREIVRLDLDTTGGPSWKPLPVIAAVPLSALGGLAVPAWLVVARTGALLAVVGVHRVATRLAGPVAGAIAVGLLVLTPDRGPRFVRLFLEGHSAPFTAALAAWAVDRHLAGRPWQTVVLLALLGLDRPEAWPFLGIYALWLGRREPRRRFALVALLVAVPLLWFVPDWWGSGAPLHGASTAQVYEARDDRLGMAIENMLEAVVAPAWVLAVAGGVVLWRRGRREIGAMVGVAVLWMSVVVAMSALQGYAALSRFQLPGAALVCVGAGAAAVLLVRAVPSHLPRAAPVALVALAVLVAAPFVVPRAVGVPSIVAEVADRGRADRELVAVVDDAGGLDHLRTCGPLMISSSRTLVAWRADVPLHDVVAVKSGREGAAIVPVDSRVDRRLAAADSGAAPLARRGGWAVYAVGCSFELGG